LRRALDGVLAQSFTDFEVIVADDASTDGTPELVQSYRDPRVRFHRQPANVGVAGNWTTALDLARGEFVCFLMDDDYYGEDFLTPRARLLEEDDQLLVVFSGYKRVDAEGRGIGFHAPYEPEPKALEGEALLRAALSREMFIGACMYRTAPVRRLWPAVRQDHYVLDYSLNVRLAMQAGAQGRCLNRLDFYVTSHPDQISQARGDEVFAQTAQVLEKLLAEPASEPYRHHLRAELSSWHVVWARKAAARGDRELALQRLRRAVHIRPSSLGAWKQLLRVAVGI
jgi:glycosyltransferase involved in cell wall biosynthesis